jgi:hypothetical protein
MYNSIADTSPSSDGPILAVGRARFVRRFLVKCVFAMRIALPLVASLVGVLAIVIKLTARSQRSWLERDLYVGDLRTLSNIAFHTGFTLPASTQGISEDHF